MNNSIKAFFPGTVYVIIIISSSSGGSIIMRSDHFYGVVQTVF